MPDASFTVTDVKNLVGGKRILEVMNCATQLNAEMTLKDFEEFFSDPDRDDTKLNVISLEFSQTRLDAHVSAPKVVRQIDFIDNVWPRHFKDQQDDSTNDMSKMLYPKVQKYSLMSIAGCYTDFHVDLGGTSVWYHLLRGQKIFWLIPPTLTNLKAFENWTLSGKQGEVFFGDMVEKCGRVVLNPGNTFFIPSGWIHAVYTPCDSLVFGGNYLHSFAMERQLKIAQIEDVLKVPQKFRFPFFTEMLWYMLDKYCYALLGRHHLNFEDHILRRLLGTEEERKNFQDNIGHPHITQHELRGLKATVLYLHSLPVNKKNVPTFIKDPVSLIRDIRIIVEVHKNDKPDRANNGRPMLFWPGFRKDASWFAKGKRKKPSANEVPKRTEQDGKMYLELDCICAICQLDGWYLSPGKHNNIERNRSTNSLMECVNCHELVHPMCLPDFGFTGEVIKEENNKWKCATCIKFPKESQDSQVSADNKKGETDPVKPEPISSDTYDLNKVKDEPVETNDMEVDQSNSTKIDIVKEENSAEQAEMDVAGNLTEESIKKELTVREEKSERFGFKVREFFSRFHNQHQKFPILYSASSDERIPLILKDPKVLLNIFQHLPTVDFLRCKSVCKDWLIVSRDKTMTRRLDFSGLKISPILINIVSNMQPENIVFNWTNIGKQQLNWLLPKVPTVRSLSLTGLEFISQISGLSSTPTNLLELDLSFVSNLNDAALNKLLLRTDDKKSSLLNLRRFALESTDISDISLRYISQQLQSLRILSVSKCTKEDFIVYLI